MKNLPPITNRAVHNAIVFNRYRNGNGGCWVYKGTNADVRAIAAHLKIARGCMTKDELIAAIVEKAPELA